MHRGKISDSNIYLVQTDTVAGFVSQDSHKLDMIKNRSSGKHYITALPDLKSLKKRTRVPPVHRNLVKRSKRTTFIFPSGRSYRVIKDPHHKKFIQKLGWGYTTSANKSDQSIDLAWAKGVADVVIEPLQCDSNRVSKIYKLGKVGLKRIR